jgi:hypothetical protein
MVKLLQVNLEVYLYIKLYYQDKKCYNNKKWNIIKKDKVNINLLYNQLKRYYESLMINIYYLFSINKLQYILLILNHLFIILLLKNSIIIIWYINHFAIYFHKNKHNTSFI